MHDHGRSDLREQAVCVRMESFSALGRAAERAFEHRRFVAVQSAPHRRGQVGIRAHAGEHRCKHRHVLLGDLLRQPLQDLQQVIPKLATARFRRGARRLMLDRRSHDSGLVGPAAIDGRLAHTGLGRNRGHRQPVVADLLQQPDRRLMDGGVARDVSRSAARRWCASTVTGIDSRPDWCPPPSKYETIPTRFLAGVRVTSRIATRGVA